tara:strand:- start:359 stop:676 length:318 start_codon:yes stop_codon:yes gene_type:complete
MLIKDVIVEGRQTELIGAIQDLLAQAMTEKIKVIDTEKFKIALAKQGHVADIDEITLAVDKSKDWITSVDKDKIVPKNSSADLDQPEPKDISKMAGNQALSDIKA